MTPEITLEQEIWSRQYAPADSPGETYPEGIDRVVDHVVKGSRVENIKYAHYWRTMMKEKRFIPGGRILAGAGSAHGNLQNCFVQGLRDRVSHDSNVLMLAKNLALVTKVGGGNGINLDPLPAKATNLDEIPRRVGRLWLYIDPDHPQFDDVRTGTFMDLNTGQRQTRGYRVAQVTDDIQSVDVDRDIIVEDSIEDIWEAALHSTTALLNGEDVLVDLSMLRPEGAKVSGGGTSSGPASFAVEVFDSFAYWAKLGGGHLAGPVAALRYVFAPTLRVIRQAGVRRGAGMATLSITHPDAEDFITCKSLEREAAEGDIGTFNISLLVPDTVMRDYEAAIPTPEATLLSKAIAHAHATGEPGFLFVDRINEHNILAEVDGPILATNPCGEQPLYPGESCNLGAINVSFYWDPDRADVYWELLEQDVHAAVRFLDAVHDADNSPLVSIRQATKDKRRLGLGMMGLADLLIKAGLRYGSPEAQELATRLARFMTASAIATSRKLADELGPAPAWERTKTGFLPRRNIALMTVAPTGTTSMLAGVSSGIEPVFSAAIKRRIGTEYREIRHPLADMPAFVTAHEVTPEEHILMQAAVQRGYDYYYWDGFQTYAGNAISKTINLPNDAEVADVANALLTAFRAGSKGFTCYRDGSRANQVLTEVKDEEPKRPVLDDLDLATMDIDTCHPPETVEEARRQIRAVVAEKRSTLDALAPFDGAEYRDVEQLATLERRKPSRPAVVEGKTYRYKVGDRKVYVTVNRDEHDHPIEVFVNLSRPSDGERVAADIIGRLISLALKHGATHQELFKHLSGHQDQTGAFASTNEDEPKALGYFGCIWEAVAKAMDDDADPIEPVSPSYIVEGELCPTCASDSLVREGTCTTCHACGWSKCG